MTARFLGIDFSGGVAPWRPSARHQTVWIADANRNDDVLELVSLNPVQNLPGNSNGFERLVSLLAGGNYSAASIDAPFSIPAAHIPDGGHDALLKLVANISNGRGRPFPKGSDLIALAERKCAKASKKPLRQCETYWASRNVNTRSTLWYKPRGGAPFAVACLALIARSGRPCWPWHETGEGLLVEAFPAAQLCHWGLPHTKYAGPDGSTKRDELTKAIAERIRISHEHAALMRRSADALDAVVAVFAGIAAYSGKLAAGTAGGHEGWIAVHK